jgi:hypothetical protein
MNEMVPNRVRCYYYFVQVHGSTSFLAGLEGILGTLFYAVTGHTVEIKQRLTTKPAILVGDYLVALVTKHHHDARMPADTESFFANFVL